MTTHATPLSYESLGLLAAANAHAAGLQEQQEIADEQRTNPAPSRVNQTPSKTPLKSCLKKPGTPKKNISISHSDTRLYYVFKADQPIRPELTPCPVAPAPTLAMRIANSPCLSAITLALFIASIVISLPVLILEALEHVGLSLLSHMCSPWMTHSPKTSIHETSSEPLLSR